MKTAVALSGEGIGVEVIDATSELMSAAGMPVKILTPQQVETPGDAAGPRVPDETRRACCEADGVLFGAGGSNTAAVVGWLRWEMDAWGGVRPAKFLPGDALPLADPAGIEFMVIRGNSEGIYPGREGDLADLKRALPDLRDTLDRCDEGRFAAKVVTRKGTEPARLASELARKPQGALSRQTHLRDQVQRFSANRRALPANDPGELNKTVLVSSESLGA